MPSAPSDPRPAPPPPVRGLKDRWYHIIFEADTPAGRVFDIVLIVLILASVVAVVIDSMPGIPPRVARALFTAEWIFTILFTVEYIVRLTVARGSARYARSFYGVVDLLAVLPTYIGLIFPGGRFLLVVRILRVLRIFRILKLATYLGESRVLARALMASRHKILVFLLTVLTLVTIIGALMYMIEGPTRGFTSIPLSIYWAIVTLSTVGYGDLAPATATGRALASLVMIIGYGIIAVPTGIVTVELSNAVREHSRVTCPTCSRAGHEMDAAHCKHCGASLAP